jgi:nucleotide-binding universal stress UspA family protein
MTLQPFRNISLVYECDRPTLRLASALAKDARARLTIVHPVSEVPAAFERVTVGKKPVDVRKLVLHEHQDRLKRFARSAQLHGIQTSTKLLVGDPSLEIIRDVIQNQRDLVIMTAEGKGTLKERLFGSTSSHLMRKCPAPLLIVKPGRRSRFHQVLAAVDPEVTGHARDTLNGAILELASFFSKREDAQLHVVHAWTLFGESLLRRHGALNAAEIKRWVMEETRRRRDLTESLLAQHSVQNYRLYLVKGNAADVIPWVVRKRKIDLLVMGTICRTGIPGFIIGNTAEKVLDTINCSVLTVKPVGFVSPVAPFLSKSRA